MIDTRTCHRSIAGRLSAISRSAVLAAAIVVSGCCTMPGPCGDCCDSCVPCYDECLGTGDGYAMTGCVAPACATPACAAPACIAPTCVAPACAAPIDCSMPMPVTCAAPACDSCDGCGAGCSGGLFRKPKWLSRLFGGCGHYGCGVCCGPSLYGDCCNGYDASMIGPYSPQFYTVGDAMRTTPAAAAAAASPAAAYPAARPAATQSPSVSSMIPQQITLPAETYSEAIPAAPYSPGIEYADPSGSITPLTPQPVPAMEPTPSATPVPSAVPKTVPPLDLPEPKTSQTEPSDSQYFPKPTIRQVAYEEVVPAFRDRPVELSEGRYPHGKRGSLDRTDWVPEQWQD